MLEDGIDRKRALLLWNIIIFAGYSCAKGWWRCCGVGGSLTDPIGDPAGESRSWTYGPRQVATTWYIDEENALPRRTNQPVAQLAKLAERGDLASCVQGGEERHRWHLWCSTIALCGVCMLLVNTLSLQRAVLRPLFPLLTTDATFSITSIIPPDALQPAS